jgi:hypothetical protein
VKREVFLGEFPEASLKLIRSLLLAPFLEAPTNAI